MSYYDEFEKRIENDEWVDCTEKSWGITFLSSRLFKNESKKKAIYFIDVEFKKELIRHNVLRFLFAVNKRALYLPDFNEGIEYCKINLEEELKELQDNLFRKSGSELEDMRLYFKDTPGHFVRQAHTYVRFLEWGYERENRAKEELKEAERRHENDLKKLKEERSARIAEIKKGGTESN